MKHSMQQVFILVYGCFLWCAAANSLEISFQNINYVKKILAEMVAEDQKLRSTIDFSHMSLAVIKKVEEQNRNHTTQLKEVLSTHYWITISEFGQAADEAAWLLVQHSDHDILFQKEILERLENLLSFGETNPRNVAYLYDRVARNEKRPQRYGTQGKIENNEWTLYDTENLPSLDSRRKEMSLPPYADYLKQIEELLKK